MKEFYKKYKKQLDKSIFLISIFFFIYIFVKYILPYILPFFIAFILSIFLEPISKFFITKVKTPRWFASLMCILLIIFIFLFIGTNLFYQIQHEAQSFRSSLPEIISKTNELFDGIQTKLNSWFSFVPGNFKTTLNNISDTLFATTTSALSSLVKDNSVNVVSKIPTFFLGFILTIISTFFFINDKKVIHEAFIKNTPITIVKGVKIIRQDMLSALSGYVKAQLIIMCIICVICIVSLYILKYPYALLVGVVISVFDAFPLLGSGFVLWPWIAFSFMNNNYNMAIGLMVTYGIVFITRQVVEPRILGKQIGIHPLITLMSIYVGIKVFGITGFFVGPLSVILAKTIITYDNDKKHNRTT